MRDYFYTAKVLSTYGIKGYLKIKPFSENLDHLYGLKKLKLEKNNRYFEYVVEDLRCVSGSYIIKFADYNSPEKASLLSGSLVIIPRLYAPRLKNDEVYLSDLVGMDLIYEDDVVGTVVSTAEGSQSYLLEVKCLDGKLRFVPFLRNIFVSDVNVSSKKMKLLRRDLVEDIH